MQIRWVAAFSIWRHMGFANLVRPNEQGEGGNRLGEVNKTMPMELMVNGKKNQNQNPINLPSRGRGSAWVPPFTSAGVG